ncbi:MAG TPA: discoidin domain-containing protein [Polyangiaceae bacterium]|nr:discoidin domain-containing protein [Polyangiaceae bacterium]
MHAASTAPAGGLVDGVVFQAYGAHTGTGTDSSPWVDVELDGVRTIDNIKIYNRGDGWFDACLPLTLQLSDDGQAFTDAEVRTLSFDQYAPWVYRAHGKTARFVRVHGAPNGCVVLSELEVYAR